MDRLFYVYILVSERDETIHYTGITTDLEQRLREHNRGSCSYTSANRPWRIETVIAFKSERKARAFAKYLKRLRSGVCATPFLIFIFRVSDFGIKTGRASSEAPVTSSEVETSLNLFPPRNS